MKVLSHLCESFKNTICPEAHWEGPCKWPLHDERLYTAIIASQFTKQEVPFWKQLLNFLRVIPPESENKSLGWHLFKQYGGDVAFVFAWSNTYICGLWFLMVPLVVLFSLAPGDEFHQPTKYWLTGCQIWVCFWAQILIMFHSLQTGMLKRESTPQVAIKAMTATATKVVKVVDIWKKGTEVDPDPDSPPPDRAAVQDAGTARPSSRQSGAGLHRIADLRAAAQGSRPGSADSPPSRWPRRKPALTEEQAASTLQRNLRHLKLRKKFQLAVYALSSSQMKTDEGARRNPDYAPSSAGRADAKGWRSDGGMIRLETLVELEFPNFELFEGVPCRAIRGNGISVSDSVRFHPIFIRTIICRFTNSKHGFLFLSVCVLYHF